MSTIVSVDLRDRAERSENFPEEWSKEKIESSIDTFELELPPITNFILPGGDTAAAQIHQVRTIVRRAETLVVKLSDKDEINSNCIKYLNRLSDLMFVMGRLINKRKGIEDIIWKP